MFIGSVIQSAAFEQSLFKKRSRQTGGMIVFAIEAGTVKTIGTAVPQQLMGKEDRYFP